MEAHISGACHKPNRPMGDPSSEKLSAPPVSPRPQNEIYEPIVLHMETWVAERIFAIRAVQWQDLVDSGHCQT